MRSERLEQLTRPRSIGVRTNGECEFEAKSGAPSTIEELNLDEIPFFDLDLFDPIEFKKFTNLNAFPYAFRDDQDVFRWAFSVLSDSPIAFALTNMMREYGWKFVFSDLETGGYHIDPENDILEIDNHGLDASSLGQSSHYRKSFLITLVKGLRDLWHEMEGDNVFENYKPESILMLERARAADIDAISILVAWELRSANHNSFWRHILSSDEGDMAQVLINIMDRYPTALYNGMAAAHIFRQWYADVERIDGCDHSTLEQVDFIIDIDADILGDKTATKEDFEALSTFPDGTYYLKELGETVARDPFFCGLNDPINQAHLFQIVYDSQVTYASGIPFRDSKLARKFI